MSSTNPDDRLSPFNGQLRLVLPGNTRSGKSYTNAAPLDDAAIYTYALKVALLQHVIANKPAPAAASAANVAAGQAAGAAGSSNANAVAATKADGATGKRESLRRTITEGNWSTGFTGLSWGDLFRGDSKSGAGGGLSSPKYPEKFVKLLRQRLEAISRGQDKEYQDMLLRYTIGAFYGKYEDPKNARVIKENRKLEDLLMMFIATATEVLKKRCTGDEWKVKLEEQVEVFARLCEEALRNKDLKHVPPELLTKLQTIKERIVGNRKQIEQPPTSPAISKRRPSFDDAKSPIAATSASTSNAYTQASVSFNLADMPGVRQVGRIFNLDPQQVQRDVHTHKKQCTERAAMSDFKQCINMISANASFPGCRDDFQTEDAYREWRSSELSNLQQAMLSMIKASPELVHSSSTSDDSPSSLSHSTNGGGAPLMSPGFEAGEAYVGSRASRASLPIADQFSNTLGTDERRASVQGLSGELSPISAISEDASSGFTYVPPSARQAYRRLLEIMLSHDLAAMADLDPSEEVPLRILSKANLDLLAECVLRWRIMPTYRFVSFLEDMTRRYTAGEMPVLECVMEALSDFDQLNEDWPHDSWPVKDRETFLGLISGIFDTLLRSFYETFAEQLPQAAVKSSIDSTEQLARIPLFDDAIQQGDLDDRFEELRSGIRRASEYLYARERDAILSQHPPSSDSIIPMLDLQNWIKTTTKRLDKTYKSPLMDAIDVPALFLEIAPALYLSELADRLRSVQMVQQPKPLYTTPGDDLAVPNQPGLKDGEVMAVYEGARELLDMHNAFCPSHTLENPINELLEPYILRWLADTDTKTLGWVRNAINMDEFDAEKAVEGDGHSHSIEDLIGSCKGAVQFVTDLKWPDEVQNALFLTKLSATVSKAIEQYASAIESLFMVETTPSKRDSMHEKDERTSAWLTRARALYQEKRLEAFPFKPTSCVKLNNIHAARQLLDKMYTTVDADRVATLTRSTPPAVPSKGQPQPLVRNLFTIKVVLGEGLSNSDGASRVDPFVTLSDERGLRIAKTRTLYETTEPRWAETFDVSVEGKMWIAATVWDRNLVDEHELLGRTYLALDPTVYSDYLPHDLWQELDSTGRLLLRVSMEGEKDDIQFYFGRAFRSLKRAENDMTRSIVDKISPFMRSCISRQSLNTLLKKGGFSYLTNNLDKLNLDRAFDKSRLDNVRNLGGNLGNLIRSRDPHAPVIPLPPSELEAANKKLPAAPAVSETKKKAALTDSEIEEPLGPLLDYLDETLSIFKKYLSESAWQAVMTKIWKEVLVVVESLLVPPLSDQPAEMKPLSDKEVDIVFKWLKFLTDFFYVDGKGVPIEDLRNPRYRAIMMIRLYYDWSTDQLMEECVRLTNQQLAGPSNTKGVARSKSVYQQRNLGTIKQRKQEKNEDADTGAAEMVMRILRMRPGAIDFIQQQMGTLNLVQEKQRKPTRLLGSIRGRGRGGRGGGRGGNRLSASINRLPPVPSPPINQQKWQQYR